jgi:hypothetical protein
MHWRDSWRETITNYSDCQKLYNAFIETYRGRARKQLDGGWSISGSP